MAAKGTHKVIFKNHKMSTRDIKVKINKSTAPPAGKFTVEKNSSDAKDYSPTPNGELEFEFFPIDADGNFVHGKIKVLSFNTVHKFEFINTGEECTLKLKLPKGTSSNDDVIITTDPPTNLNVEIDEPDYRKQKQKPKGK